MIRCEPPVDLSTHPQARRARKRSGTVLVNFALEAGELITLEGPVRYLPGAALITGHQGDRWPVEFDVFTRRYRPAQGQAMGQDGAYDRLPIDVWALQLTWPLTVAAGAFGDGLQGQVGDWCVQYGPGDQAIVAQSVFSSSYEFDS